MTISTMSAGNTLPASKLNEIIGALNTMNNGRVIMLSSGNFTWPVGIDAIEVILCGGGGRSGNTYNVSSVQQPSSRGGNSPLCSKIITGVDAGTTIPVVVGAAGVGTAAGGTTSFGAGQPYAFQSTGGTGGNNANDGADGTHTGDIQLGNQLFVAINNNVMGTVGYGQGFPSNRGSLPVNYSVQGGPGIVVIRY